MTSGSLTHIYQPQVCSALRVIVHAEWGGPSGVHAVHAACLLSHLEGELMWVALVFGYIQTEHNRKMINLSNFSVDLSQDQIRRLLISCAQCHYLLITLQTKAGSGRVGGSGESL